MTQAPAPEKSGGSTGQRSGTSRRTPESPMFRCGFYQPQDIYQQSMHFSNQHSTPQKPVSLSVIRGLVVMGKKRGRSEAAKDADDATAQTFSVGSTLDRLNARPPDQQIDHDEQEEEWEVAGSKKKRKTGDNGEPAIYHANHLSITSAIGLKDLQNIITYLLCDDSSPKWVAIRHKSAIRRVVALTVPGLEPGMFDGSVALSGRDTAHDPSAKRSPRHSRHGPDEYYPKPIRDKASLDSALEPLAEIFPHVWPIDVGGNFNHTGINSPLQGMLQVPLSTTKDKKPFKKGPNAPKYAKDWVDKPTAVETYLASIDDLLTDDYILHASQVSKMSDGNSSNMHLDAAPIKVPDGFVETQIPSDVPTALEADAKGPDWKVLAIDCEMCQTASDPLTLTRIAIVDWNNETVMDELVKPSEAITDYVTHYSGITAEMLAPVTTTLSDIHTRLRELITPHTILVGHSLVSDLKALKWVHPHIIDTTLLFPHPKGPPLKSSLKFLAQKYLGKEIQKGGNGHSPTEDAKTAMSLVRQKCDKGPAWGTFEATEESIFARMGRLHPAGDAEAQKLHTTIVDWGSPERGHGFDASAALGCSSDAEVVAGLIGAVAGQDIWNKGIPARGSDFVWGRLRELEAKRGWWTQGRSTTNEASRIAAGAESIPGEGEELGAAVRASIAHVQRVWDHLPKGTAFIVYSGSGDARPLKRYNDLHRQYKSEFQVKKWDETQVRWTDAEERGRKDAARKARSGVGFVAVK